MSFSVYFLPNNILIKFIYCVFESYWPVNDFSATQYLTWGKVLVENIERLGVYTIKEYSFANFVKLN